MQQESEGSWERLQRFRRATRYGPIFVCSSCHQKLFEHEVVPLEQSFQDEVNENHDGAFSMYVDEKVEISFIIKEGNTVRGPFQIRIFLKFRTLAEKGEAGVTPTDFFL